MNVCRRGRDPAVHLSASGHWPHLISPPAVREAGTTWELLHSNRLSTQTWVQVLTARCLLDVFTHCHITASGALICSWRKVSLFGVVCVKAAMFDQFLGFSVNAPCVASLWSRRANTAWRVMFIAHVVWKPIRGDERDSQRVFVCLSYFSLLFHSENLYSFCVWFIICGVNSAKLGDKHVHNVAVDHITNSRCCLSASVDLKMCIRCAMFLSIPLFCVYSYISFALWWAMKAPLCCVFWCQWLLFCLCTFLFIGSLLLWFAATRHRRPAGTIQRWRSSTSH